MKDKRQYIHTAEYYLKRFIKCPQQYLDYPDDVYIGIKELTFMVELNDIEDLYVNIILLQEGIECTTSVVNGLGQFTDSKYAYKALDSVLYEKIYKLWLERFNQYKGEYGQK